MRRLLKMLAFCPHLLSLVRLWSFWSLSNFENAQYFYRMISSISAMPCKTPWICSERSKLWALKLNVIIFIVQYVHHLCRRRIPDERKNLQPIRYSVQNYPHEFILEMLLCATQQINLSFGSSEMSDLLVKQLTILCCVSAIYCIDMIRSNCNMPSTCYEIVNAHPHTFSHQNERCLMNAYANYHFLIHLHANNLRIALVSICRYSLISSVPEWCSQHMPKTANNFTKNQQKFGAACRRLWWGNGK